MHFPSLKLGRRITRPGFALGFDARGWDAKGAFFSDSPAGLVGVLIFSATVATGRDPTRKFLTPHFSFLIPTGLTGGGV